MRLTILIAEDEAPIMRLVTRILEPGRYEMLYAVTAEEALRISAERQSPIDLLLANVILPDMLGTQLAANLKKARPAMRVILMSGKERGNLAVLQGGWQYLSQPFLRQELAERIRAELEGRRARGGAG